MRSQIVQDAEKIGHVNNIQNLKKQVTVCRLVFAELTHILFIGNFSELKKFLKFYHFIVLIIKFKRKHSS